MERRAARAISSTHRRRHPGEATSASCADDYRTSIDMATALHSQTILALDYGEPDVAAEIRLAAEAARADEARLQEPEIYRGDLRHQRLSRRLLGRSGLQLVQRVVTLAPAITQAGCRLMPGYAIMPARARVGRMTAAKGGSAEALAARVKSEADLACLMAAAQDGDAVCYQSLLRACLPLIGSMARGHGVPADRVDDVVQDVLVTVHRVRATYDPARPFMPWLRAIAQRRAIDAMRSHGRQRSREVHAPLAYESHADTAATAAQEPERSDGARGLHAAVAALPDGQRQAVEELALRERTLEEAAANTGRSKGALKVNLHRALKALRPDWPEEMTRMSDHTSSPEALIEILARDLRPVRRIGVPAAARARLAGCRRRCRPWCWPVSPILAP